MVIYNLPGRDCFALVSNGELPANDEGLRRYKEDYIDVITAMFAEEKYETLRIVTVIEPDSLPNLVTNADGAAQLFAEVVRSTTAGFAAVDGFITNTANYTPLVEPYLTNPEHQVGGQPIKASNYCEWNPVFDEISWTANLHQRLVSAGFPSSIGMLIDTSRNGWGGAARPTSASSAADLDTYINQSKVVRGAVRRTGPQCLPCGFRTPASPAHC